MTFRVAAGPLTLLTHSFATSLSKLPSEPDHQICADSLSSTSFPATAACLRGAPHSSLSLALHKGWSFSELKLTNLQSHKSFCFKTFWEFPRCSEQGPRLDEWELAQQYAGREARSMGLEQVGRIVDRLGPATRTISL